LTAVSDELVERPRPTEPRERPIVSVVAAPPADAVRPIGERGSLAQYRRVAAVLDDAQTTRRVKTIVVTSAVPCEGKTRTVLTLARILSESYGRRVLLLDADLRQPSLHEAVGVRNDEGVSEALRDEGRPLRVVEVTPLLSLLPAGQPAPDPLAALASDRVEMLLDECSDNFDWVLLDTPPVSLLSDARILARRSQGVVFVIGARSAPFSIVEPAIAALGRDCIIATVLDGMDEQLGEAEDGSVD
jgi:capsular exopolysaccharide synthesis family protein